jgi:C-terminal processing protease CtpA/Prc
MSETLAAIFAENPNVKNIGIDLSYNTGGNIGALLRVLGYITEKPIEMSYQDPLTGQKQTYFVTLDQEAYETVNWFFITSPVTFSAANLMTAIVKNQKLGPIFGTTSGGGAASINPFILAEGTLISISSNNLISIRTKNPDNSYTYTDVEDGIEPDLILSPRNTQNPVKILELIEEYFGG